MHLHLQVQMQMRHLHLHLHLIALRRMHLRCHSTLACSALTRVSLERFTLATSILTRFQFGAFLFDALPLRRISLWRASTSARYSLARFPILYEPTMIRYLRTPVSRGLFPFCEEMLSTPVWHVSLCVAYLFALMFPICEEVFSTPV